MKNKERIRLLNEEIDTLYSLLRDRTNEIIALDKRIAELEAREPQNIYVPLVVQPQPALPPTITYEVKVT